MLKLAWFKALAELRVEAARRYLGVLWWILEPVLYMATFYVIFAMGLRMGGENYVAFLLCGLVPWKWFSSTLQVGANVIAENKGLMNQIYFHKSMLVGMLMIVNFIKALIVFCILFLALLVMGLKPSVHWLGFIPVLLTLFLFIYGAVSVAASLVPLLPDLRIIIDNTVLVLFFASGIFFDISERAPELQNLLFLNPVAILLDATREVLINNAWPNWGALAYSLGIGIACLLLGHLLIHRFDRSYAKVVA